MRTLLRWAGDNPDREGLIDTIQHSRIEAIMVDISNAQGAMERLRNTPLPAQYRSFPTFFTRLFCVLLPIGLVESLGPATPMGSALAGFMFLAALQIDAMGEPAGDVWPPRFVPPLAAPALVAPPQGGDA